MDTDIKQTQASLISTEKKLGNWNPKQDKDGAYVVPEPYQYIQTESMDDPICSSAGCTQFKHPEEKTHPMNYPVPSFGADPEMETTHNSIAIGEAQYNHKLIMGTDESKAQWKNPAAAKENRYDFNPALDHDVKVTASNLANAESTLGKTMEVADVQLESDPICSSAGCTQYEHPKIKDHPMDYFVPNFGPDQEAVKENDNSLAVAEKQLNHKLVIPKAPEHDKDYVVPHLGVDADILATQASEQQASDTLQHDWVPTQDKNGYWNVPQPFDNKSYSYAGTDINVQLSSETTSDPICSSAGCTQYEHPKLETHPMDYPVPNFGVDHAILANHASLENAEKQLKHHWVWEEHKKEDPVYYDDGTVKGLDSDITHSLNSMADQEAEKGAWNPVQDKDGNWIVPQAIDNRSYSYDTSDVQLESDPICSSAGCTQYEWPAAPKSHPVDYPVPNFGKDPDMVTTNQSLAAAEKIQKHHWNFHFYDTPINPAKKTLYDFNAPLADDIVHSQNSLSQAEEQLGTPMVIWDEPPKVITEWMAAVAQKATKSRNWNPVLHSKMPTIN